MAVVPVFNNTTGSNQNYNGQLEECSFRGISFPVESVNLEFSQDLVQHKKPNVAGAKVEGTGFNPITIHVKTCLYNNLYRGATETWDDSNLFPGVHNQLLSALIDNSAGPFVHPTLGTYHVKPVKGSSQTNATTRNGQAFEFELITTNPGEIDSILAQTDGGLAYSSAQALDTQLAQPALSNLAPPISFTNMIQQITGLLGQVSLTVQKVNGLINQAMFQAQRIENAVDDLDASFATLRQNLERIKSALNSLRFNASKRQSHLALYFVPKDTTLAGVASTLAVTVESLLSLNPELARKTTVPEGTDVVYAKAL